MKIEKLGVALVALTLGAMVGCHKGDGSTQPAAGTTTTTGVANSSGSFAPDAQGVPGTETDASGVGATGVSPGEIAAPPTNVPTSNSAGTTTGGNGVGLTP